MSASPVLDRSLDLDIEVWERRLALRLAQQQVPRIACVVPRPVEIASTRRMRIPSWRDERPVLGDVDERREEGSREEEQRKSLPAEDGCRRILLPPW